MRRNKDRHTATGWNSGEDGNMVRAWCADGNPAYNTMAYAMVLLLGLYDGLIFT